MNKLCRRRLLLLLLLATSVVSAATQETQRQYLSGRGKDDAVPWRFLCTTGALSGFWTNIAVPSNWEMKGFGHLTYKKDYTNAWTERGMYEREFAAPQSWSSQRVFLVFEGVMTDTSARLNGQSVGPTHQGGFYRFKYEITDLLKFGATNLLEVEVAKHSTNESVNKAERLADYWVFGGIYRPVYLEVVPKEFIERVAIDAKADGTFAMDVFLNGATNADFVEAQVQTLDGKPVGSSAAAQILISQTPSIPSDSEIDKKTPIEKALATPMEWHDANNNLSASTAFKSSVVKILTRVDSVKDWTAESPNLYQIEVRLVRGKTILHTITQRFGFRTFEVRDGDGLCVNGQKVILKGVNRHSFWPDSGRCLSTDVHKLDIQAIKDMNANAVRMSHYPPDAEFLDLCDELGLYVMDELAGWHNFYDNTIGPKLVEEMVTHDVNHPSILFWANGDEGGFNTNLNPVFLQFDPQQRRVLLPWASFNGLCTAHYLGYDKAEIAAGGKSVYFKAPDQELVATNDPTHYIYMPTEFMHGLYDGGAGAGMEDYWRMMMSHTNCAGGFIWALLDEGVKRPDTGEIDLAGNQAPDGIVGPYREREASFYAIKQIWSPIQIKHTTDDEFVVENHFDFTDTKQCRFQWELRTFDWPTGFSGKTNPDYKSFAKGIIEPPQIAPGGSRTIRLQLPANWERERVDALAIRVTDPSGREIYTRVWPLPQMDTLSQMPNFSSRQAQLGEETADHINMIFEGMTARINKKTGLLDGVERGRSFSFTNGPRAVVGESRLTGIQTNTSGGDVTVAATFDGALEKILWTVRGDGWLRCDYSYRCAGTNDSIGVVFDYPEDLVKGKRWLGDGPYRVWKNRRAGVSLNVWDNEYNDTITGYTNWIYPEFKGCFANVRWLQLKTTEGSITAVTEDIPYVQVLTPGQPPDNLIGKTMANLARCGLGFLHAIPAIGTKFKTADQGGPQGQPNVGTGHYSGSVSFRFDPPQ